MSNVIIIGSGPAGVSAALYTIRAGIETVIISKGNSALKKAEKIENYYGFSEAIAGQRLSDNAIEGAKRLGAKFIDEEVVGITFEDKLTVRTTSNSFNADGIIIATGSVRETSKIKGVHEFEGKGISYCAVCDAFFYRNKDVAVLGNGEYALHEAMELSSVVKSVTILTNGKNMTIEIPSEIKKDEREISLIMGDEFVSGIKFSDGNELAVSGVFIAYGVAGSADLAKKIGAVTDKNNIVVDGNMATNIPGLYAAGDCTGGLLQISKAVYEGAKAGTEIAKYIKNK